MMYFAQQTLTSAMTSIAFSTMLLMNIINTRLFFGKRIEPRTYFGACLGVLGVVALFWDDLQAMQLGDGAIEGFTSGLALVLTGTLIASLGNMVSVRNSNHQLNIFAANAWGMTYGCLVLLVFALARGVPFTFSLEASYLISLFYLALFGTVIADVRVC